MARIASIQEFSSFAMSGDVIAEDSFQAHTFRPRDSHYMHDTVKFASEYVYDTTMKGIPLTRHIPTEWHPHCQCRVSTAAQVRRRGGFALSCGKRGMSMISPSS
ncbi:hypothetical protein ASPNIDRAFT_42739 [Aspergillus niger ATCC 1015]|uniref:Uncharacterized protein n=1 Tax=Aspergillus niger (strain ATCC 1015 / CBS 113.46 / FGSC A1144 / LSHB Ac4 / NCTC 3858a / NRRL 328 / USDA 3528.7) TaxID=380704 RepID=G3YDR0_ASPNA|nr:hypothetical protein ASPNIDRAFT_42739 [Aspergillus niger ATCC 1015]